MSEAALHGRKPQGSSVSVHRFNCRWRVPMVQECAKCVELRQAINDSERARRVARDRFEGHTRVAAAEAGAKNYREASDAFNRAITDMAAHRREHESSK